MNVRPFTFRSLKSGKGCAGEPANDNSALNGRGGEIEQLLINYTKRYNKSTLPVERQNALLLQSWRIVNLANPNVQDDELDRR